jgi:hypothetical protein
MKKGGVTTAYPGPDRILAKVFGNQFGIRPGQPPGFSTTRQINPGAGKRRGQAQLPRRACVALIHQLVQVAEPVGVLGGQAEENVRRSVPSGGLDERADEGLQMLLRNGRFAGSGLNAERVEWTIAFAHGISSDPERSSSAARQP